MSLIVALLVGVLLLAAIIYLFVRVINPSEPKAVRGAWRVTTEDLAHGRMVGVFVDNGVYRDKIDAADKDALDFSDQLRELRGEAQVIADQRNEAESDVKVLDMEV